MSSRTQYRPISNPIKPFKGSMLFLTGRLAISTGIALTCSTMFVGGNAVITYLTLPSLLLSPPSRGTSEASSNSSQPATHSDHLARQWQSVYDLGKKVGPACHTTRYRYSTIGYSRATEELTDIVHPRCSIEPLNNPLHIRRNGKDEQ